MSDPGQPTTFNVATSDQLWTALHSAHSGDTVLLAPGVYTRFAVTGLHFTGGVTVTSADPSHEAVIDSLALGDNSGLTFDHLEVVAVGTGFAVTVTGASNLVFSNLTLHGDSAGLSGAGFMIRNATNITVTQSDFSHMGSGLGHLSSNGLTFTNNTFHDLGTDGIYGGGSANVVVQGNTFTDFHPAVGVHPDAIQFWNGSDGTHGNNITIADNVITRGAGDPIQGIFIEDTDHLVISGNALAGTMTNGISVTRSSEVLIQDNFVQGFLDMGARIIVRGQSVDVTVSNNVVQSIQNYQDGGLPNPGYVETNNMPIAGTSSNDLSALNNWISQHGLGSVDVPIPVGQPVPPPLPIITPNMFLPLDIGPMTGLSTGWIL